MLDPLQDGISKVELLDYMGDDLMVVNAARVSYEKTSDWEYETHEHEYGSGKPGQHIAGLSSADTKLLHYLAVHHHWTPFSHPQLQFRIKMPLFIAREWYRHTVGLTRNEVSRRYVKSEPEFYLPQEWRCAPEPGQSKQGSSGYHEDSDYWTRLTKMTTDKSLEYYTKMIEEGVAPEQARIVLPVSTYTEFTETGSLYAYARIASLRIQPDSQQETRKYAEAVSELIAPLFPVSWRELTNA